ncbi:hypothetical protein EV702DRAFT_1045316 [Suillus placidus]|uniref:Uncharacterized protein n=1 Tax=Suillus placidus TaxID=48579 RepID=A0A9P6ZW05_9AGAM|nr:hypothetical protein EV702DRAFT_1045316 [Suillus placidus]
MQPGLMHRYARMESLRCFSRLVGAASEDTHRGQLDNWTTVMLNNISRDPRFISSGPHYTQQVTNITWSHQCTLMVWLTNYTINSKQHLTPRAKELVSAYKELLASKTIVSEALTKILQMKWMKGNKSRDLASEPQSVMGMMALHTMAWDWLSPTLKNSARDIEPCMKAIAVECKYLNTYHPKMLQDKFIGVLHQLIKVALTPGMKKVQTINAAGQLSSIQCLILENQDCEAINKLISYILNMPCAHSSTELNALLVGNIVGPLQDLIMGLEVNSTRLHTRKLSKDPNLPFDLQEVNYNLGIQVPRRRATNLRQYGYTVVSACKQEDKPEPEEEQPAPKKKSKKGKCCAVNDQDMPVPEPEEEEPAPKTKSKKGTGHVVNNQDMPVPEPDNMQLSSPAHSKSAAVEVTPGSKVKTPELRSTSQPAKASSRKPRPHPIPRKQYQQSPPSLDDEIEIINNLMNAGDNSDNATFNRNRNRLVPAQSAGEATIPSSERHSADGPDKHTDMERALETLLVNELITLNVVSVLHVQIPSQHLHDGEHGLSLSRKG